MIDPKQLPISEYQKRFFLEWILNPDSCEYNQSAVFKISGNLNKAKLKQSCDIFIQKHAIVHARYNFDGSKCFYGNFIIDDFYQELHLEQSHNAKEYIESLLSKPFNLLEGPCCRFYLLMVVPGINYFIMSSQHIIADAISSAISITEIAENYNLLILNKKIPEHRSKLFIDAINVEQVSISKKNVEVVKMFWQEKLSDLPLVVELPKRHTGVVKQNSRQIYFFLSNDELLGFRKLRKESRSTIFLVLSAIYGLVLSKYCNQNQLILTYPIDMRPLGFAQVEGCFVNNLPLLINLNNKDTLLDIIKNLGQQALDVEGYEWYSLTNIIHDQKKIRNEFEQNYFNIGIIETNLNAAVMNLDGLQVEVLDYTPHQHGIYDVSLAYDTSSDTGIKFKLEFKCSIFDEHMIQGVVDALKKLVINCYEHKDIMLPKINILSTEDYQKTIYTWNQTEKKYPEDKTVHQLFEEQVEKTPNNIAVVYEDIKLTFQELNKRSNQLAHYLRKTYKIKGDDLIALCLNRSEYMLIAILATLKSGGAYVPMDPTYPDERIRYILEDTKAKVVLTNEVYKEKLTTILQNIKQSLSDSGVNISYNNTSNMDVLCTGTTKAVIPDSAGTYKLQCDICYIDETKLQRKLRKEDTINPKMNITCLNLAYVIYTSGTTGKPKGVMLQHQGIVNRIVWMNNEYPLKEQDRILQKTPYVFDVSVWELLWANWYGACIVFAKPDGHKDTDYLINVINKNKITVIHFVPSMLDVFNQTLENKKAKLDNLRYIFCSGEALQLYLVKTNQKLLPKVEIHNLYGPTEASVDVLYYNCSSRDIDAVHIGKPIDNTTVYVLNNDLNPLLPGAIGELYVGGVGLARGYLNRPELTAEMFILNPFQTEVERQQGKNGRLYKTGDLVRYLTDGNLEYIGRNDFQVKIRGFRIELGEIENLLSSYEGIKQVVVLVKEHKLADFTETSADTDTSNSNNSGNKYLVAYYVADQKLDEESILKYLSKKLPEYMVPSVLMWLEKLPLTINGKLDRRALPDPDFTNQDMYVAPRNGLEAKICSIFAEVLGLDSSKVGRNADFFRMGGDSILAIQFVVRLNRLLLSDVKVVNIFKERNIVNIAEFIKQNKKLEKQENTYHAFKLMPMVSDSVNLSLIDDMYPASYLQIGMLFESSIGNNGTYHDVFVYRIDAKFDENRFIEIWEGLINKHELLRARFVVSNNGYDCIIQKNVQLEYTTHTDHDISKLINEERLNDFDYSKAGLFRLIVNISVNNQFDLVFSFHHAITDGWSIASLINEFIMCYINNAIISDAKIVHYGEFIQEEQLALSRQSNLKFWQAYLAGVDVPSITWKHTKEKSQNSMYYSKFKMTGVYAKKLQMLAKKLNVSVDSIFLCSYIFTLFQFLNQTDITIGLTVNNRLEKDGGDTLFGLFLNTIPYRINVEEFRKKDLSAKILEIYNEKVKLYEYKHYPFGKIKSLLGHDLYQFAFNFVNFYILNESKDSIVSTSIYERTNIPFLMSVSQFGLDSFSILLMAHDDFIEQRYLDYFREYIEHNISELLNNSSKFGELTSSDYQKIIYDWNKTEKAYPDNKTIHQLFEEQVKISRSNIAIVYEDTKLTYRELNVRSNQLANYLRKTYKIKGDDLIALCLDRSEYMLIAIIATLKAGGAYVPMDPSYPNERISYILEDTKAKLVLTNVVYKEKIEQVLTTITIASSKTKTHKTIMPEIDLIDENKFQAKLQKEPTTNLKTTIKSQNLAYVIYTSGTTGKPKGVMLEHASVINLVSSLSYKYGIQPSEKILLFANYIFDASVEQMLLSLTNGCSLVIPNKEDIKDSAKLLDIIMINQVTHLHTTPSYLESIDYSKFSNLKRLISGGDYLSAELYKRLTASINIVINEYGPTETTVTALVAMHNIGIGKAIDNYTVYILDNNFNPLPIGVIGELYIGGVGLARGYLNRADLTLEKFISNPFQTGKEKQAGKNSRLYKTGDLVRYLADGNIEYIGRNDFQVKIRGFRIELGEIESALNSYAGIKQVVVLAKEHKFAISAGTNVDADTSNSNESSGNKYLVGYYVAAEKLDEEAIFADLANKLPEYMVPSILVWLEKFPLTINGKLDRKALPDPEFTNKDNYAAPRNELESKVCAIYAEVLGLPAEKIGITDDFFRLGGDSIVSIQLVSRLRQKLNLQVSVKDVFSCKTVEKLYDQVISLQFALNDNKTAPIIRECGVLVGEVPLLPIQEWFFSKLATVQISTEISTANKLSKTSVLTVTQNNLNLAKPGHWNQSFLVRINQKLDLELLKLSVEKLVEYHDAFRLNYNYVNKRNEYQQYYNVSMLEYYNDSYRNNTEIKYLDISKLKDSEKDSQEILTKWQSEFELCGKKPLYSVGYIDGYKDGSSRVYFALHHLLVDAVSWRIIGHDLGDIYTKLRELNAKLGADLTQNKKNKNKNELDVLNGSDTLKKAHVNSKNHAINGANVNANFYETKNSLLTELAKVNVEELLGKKGTSYRQWVNIVKTYGLKNEKEKEYWNQELIDLAENQAKLKKLIKAEESQNYESFKLNKATTNLLLTKVNQAYNTEINDVLLSAFGIALAKITKVSINYITLEGHGREEIDESADINRTVGWYTSMYPVKLKVDPSSLRNTLITTKDNLRKIPNKGIGYGAIYGYVERELPRVSFNYLGQFDNSNGEENANAENRSNPEGRTNNVKDNITVQESVKEWIIAGERSGESVATENHDTNIISANGFINNGELFFGISSKLKDQALKELVIEFKQQLENIVEHTTKLTRSYLTRYDVGNIISQAYLDKLQEKEEIGGVYLANSLQQGFIYHVLSQEQDTAYRVQLVFNYNNELEPELLKQAWSGALKRYPGLRLRFAWDEALVQIIDNAQELNWNYLDISKENEKVQQKIINKLITEDRKNCYDLASGHLLRIHLIKQEIDKNKYTCLMSSHHAILDGWSNPRLLQYVHELYLELYKNRGKRTEQEKILTNIKEEHTYKLSQKYLQDTYKEAENYWQREIARIEEYPDLCGLLKPNKRNIQLATYRSIEERSEIEIELKNKDYTEIKELSQKHGITLNTLLQYVWHRLLSIYGNSKTTIVGTTISGRNLPIAGIEESVGLYINTLPLIVEHNNDDTILNTLKNLQDKINELNTHSNISLAKLQKEGRRLFDSLFVYENYPIGENKEDSLIKLSFTKGIEELDYPLGLTAYEHNAEIIVNIKYAGELFAKDTITSLLATFKTIVTEIANKLVNSDVKEQKTPVLVKDITYLNKEEYKKMVYDWNQTKKSYPSTKMIHQLFEEQVERTPDNIAIVYEDTKLTYKELNKRSNQLANYLRKTHKIKGDDLIALCLDRSEYMLIAILAVLKSGGAYVPISPSYPDERISYILEDTKAKVVLTDEIHVDKLNGIRQNATDIVNSSSGNRPNLMVSNIASKIATIPTRGGSYKLNLLNEDASTIVIPVKTGIHNLQGDVCCIDESEFQAKLQKEPTTNLEANITSQNLAYVIYTSGTTGNPKGSIIEHHSFVNLNLWYSSEFDFKDTDKSIICSEICFDLTQKNYFTPVLTGGTLYIPSGGGFDPVNIAQIILKNNIKRINCAPSAYELVISAIYNMVDIYSFDYVFLGGEAISQHILQITKDKMSSPGYLVNTFGPSECSDITTFFRVAFKDLLKNTLPIGKPIDNVKNYVLDRNLNPLPIGVVGELYIGGVGLSRGYLNLPELTADKFISNPFQTETEKSKNKNSKLYKTGDLVRYLADGNIEYIGRNDFQIKIRGFRVELMEIESALSSYPGIKQVAVVTKERKDVNGIGTGSKYLAAYYVADKKLDEGIILKYLSEKLPEYMVPSSLIYLEELPLTINGKLDIVNLPEVNFIDAGNNYVAPKNKLEVKICNIFAEILRLDSNTVGVNDDFFKMGGDSVSAIKLVGKINNCCRSSIKLVDILVGRTPEKLIIHIIRTKENYQTIVKLNDTFDKPNIFMIHPAMAGCEVYASLAYALLNSYSCYGVDSYNLHNINKIQTLHGLAQYYITYIEKIMLSTKQNKYILLGWSWGGQIAAEIALILETRGVKDISIIMLDTFIPNDKMLKLRNKLNNPELSKTIISKLLDGYDDEYIVKVTENLAIEEVIGNTMIQRKLKYSKIYLIKAILINDKTLDDSALNKLSAYGVSLGDNNISSLCNKPQQQLYVLNAKDKHHWNILEATDLIQQVLKLLP